MSLRPNNHLLIQSWIWGTRALVAFWSTTTGTRQIVGHLPPLGVVPTSCSTATHSRTRFNGLGQRRRKLFWTALCFAVGFERLVRRSDAWKYFLRYYTQAERLYRRAIEEFERLKAQRSELPNEPTADSELDEIASSLHPKPAANEPTEPTEPPPPSPTLPSPAPYRCTCCSVKTEPPNAEIARRADPPQRAQASCQLAARPRSRVLGSFGRKRRPRDKAPPRTSVSRRPLATPETKLLP